jgi:hypothetical protein
MNGFFRMYFEFPEQKVWPIGEDWGRLKNVYFVGLSFETTPIMAKIIAAINLIRKSYHSF